MAFKINPEDFKKAEENAKKAFPKPFPEIMERMNLPTDKLIEVMQNHIERLFNNGGVSNVLDYRNELASERKQVQARLEKGWPFDSELSLEIVIDYFDMFIAQINAVKNDLIKRANNTKYSDKRVKHGEKDAIIKYWKENRATYLTDKYKFKSSDYYNQSEIARDIKRDGKFSSSLKLIIDYTNLKDL